MATTAVTLTLDEVQEGMELEADVMDGVERVLVRAGVAITERHLRIFRMCGIQDIRVRRDGTEEASAPDPDDALARARADAEVRPRFRRADLLHAPTAAIFATCVERRAHRAQWAAGAHDA